MLLRFAVRSGHFAVARLLLDGGAAVSATDKDGQALHHDVAVKNEVVAQPLMYRRGYIQNQLIPLRRRLGMPASSNALISSKVLFPATHQQQLHNQPLRLPNCLSNPTKLPSLEHSK